MAPEVLEDVAAAPEQEIKTALPSQNGEEPKEESSQEESHDVPRYFRRGKVLIILIVHGIFCLALVLAMALGLNDYKAIDTSSPRTADGVLRLRVSDVQTLISMALVIIKFFVTSWTAIAVWLCVYMLRHQSEETDSSKSGVFDRIPFMVQWKLPPWLKLPFLLPRRIQNWGVAALLLLNFAQSFLGPLISGSVDWNPSYATGSGTIQVSSVDQSADFTLWHWYNSPGTVDAKENLRRAAGLAGLAWADQNAATKNGTSITGNGCRHVLPNPGPPVNSTLENAVIPCIRFHSLQWVNSDSDITQNAKDTITSSQGSANISVVGDPPVTYYKPGVAVAYASSQPRKIPSRTDVPPNGTVFSGTMTVGVLISRHNTTSPHCANLGATIFGEQSILPGAYLQTGNSNYEDCYVMGTVNFTAGVTSSRQSTYITSRVVEDQTPINQVVFEPNSWVQESLYLLPDLMTMVAMMNSSLLPTWDNLDLYTELLIRQSYLAAWDMFHLLLDETGPDYTVALSESRIKATVSFARVFSWLGVSLLMTATGCLTLFLIPVSSGEQLDPQVLEDMKADSVNVVNEMIDLQVSNTLDPSA